MSVENLSPGFNGKFYWFTAVVENTDDPRKLGRLRCRIIGKDTELLNKQPSEDLAWATPLHPLTGTHMSLDVKPSDYVFGFFLDDKSCQMPVILGVYPGIKRAEYDTSKGFSPQLTSEQKQQEPVPPPGVIVAGKVVNTATGASLMCRGDYEGTLVEQTNKEVVHVCDIATQLKRSVIWERLKHSQFVSQIRQAIEALIKALGFSPDSLSQRLVELAKWLRRKLKDIQDIIKELNDYVQITVEVSRQLRAIVDWILSLPARLQAALSNCLSAFLSGVSSLLSDVLTLPSASGSGISDVINEVKKTFQQAGETIDTATNLLAVPAQIVDAALTPASVSDVAKVQSAVSSYITQQTETNQSATNVVNLLDRKMA